MMPGIQFSYNLSASVALGQGCFITWNNSCICDKFMKALDNMKYQ